jgi:hypothetical protein
MMSTGRIVDFTKPNPDQLQLPVNPPAPEIRRIDSTKGVEVADVKTKTLTIEGDGTIRKEDE